MCGSLRHNNDWLKQGASLYIRELASNIIETGTWSGFAKFENITNWKIQGWKIGILNNINAYSEKDNIYRMGDHRNIAAIFKDNNIRIITRSAKGQEKYVHNRWPLILYKDPSAFAAYE
tara:strand:+ start:507 stop:863 length:357 start_codon:yes stop_codon:yes gene_type:complete